MTTAVVPNPTCMSILNEFLRLINPAWRIPSAGVWSITNAVAQIIIAVSPLSTSHGCETLPDIVRSENNRRSASQ